MQVPAFLCARKLGFIWGVLFRGYVCGTAWKSNLFRRQDVRKTRKKKHRWQLLQAAFAKCKTHFLLLMTILWLSSNSCTLLVLFLFSGQVHLMPPAKACFFHDWTQTCSSIKQAPRNKSHSIGYGQGKELKFISIVLARKAETFYNVPEIIYLEGICGMFWSFFSYLEIISVWLLK